MTGARLLLMRHAKAQWPAPGTNDFDRPLTADGIRQAQEAGARMAQSGFVPDSVLCSGARRCRETWDAMSEYLTARQPDYLDGLYNSDPAGYLAIIRRHATGRALLVIGHNPMTEELAMAVTSDTGGRAPSALAGGFPTAALAVIGLSRALSELAPATGKLEAFLNPGSAPDSPIRFPA